MLVLQKKIVTDIYILSNKVIKIFLLIALTYKKLDQLFVSCLKNSHIYCNFTLSLTPRITMLVDRLCKLYGSPVATVDGTTWNSFPRVTSLAESGVEETLREHGFGYRYFLSSYYFLTYFPFISYFSSLFIFCVL